MVHYHGLKRSFDGRYLLMDDDKINQNYTIVMINRIPIWWKKTINGKWPSIKFSSRKDNPWWMTICDLGLKTEFDGMQLLAKDNLYKWYHNCKDVWRFCLTIFPFQYHRKLSNIMPEWMLFDPIYMVW